MDLGAYCLFRCGRCGSWSSDALARGARTSFEPDAYFANADADRVRWEDLLGRAGVVGADAVRVLDVGCGRGDFLRFLGAQHPRFARYGIELEPERAAAARAADRDAKIQTGEAAAALAELSGCFDLITLWDVFEHLVDPRDVLCALASRLTPGGVVFLQTIHEQSAVPALGRAIHVASGGRICGPARRTHEPHHLVFFSRRGLEELASAAGLRIRALWFDRLAMARMDGSRALAAATAALLAVENALGNGLFVNLLLEKAPR
jgi:SAM-dependent methyltransferase